MGSCRWQVARDIGQEKPVSVLQGLARLADVPVYVALYTSSRFGECDAANGSRF